MEQNRNILLLVWHLPLPLFVLFVALSVTMLLKLVEQHWL